MSRDIYYLSQRLSGWTNHRPGLCFLFFEKINIFKKQVRIRGSIYIFIKYIFKQLSTNGHRTNICN